MPPKPAVIRNAERQAIEANNKKIQLENIKKNTNIDTAEFHTIFNVEGLCEITNQKDHIVIPATLCERIIKMEGEWKGYKKECSTLSKNNATQKNTINTLITQNEALIKLKDALEENIKKINESNASLAEIAKKSVEAYENERDSRMKEREEYKEKFEAFTSTIEEIKARNEGESKLGKKNEELLKLIQTRTEELISEKKKVGEVTSQNVLLKKSYDEIKAEFSSTIEKFSAVLQNIDQQKQLLEASQQLCTKQEQVNEQLKARNDLLSQKLEASLTMNENFKSGMLAQWDEIKKYRFVIECLRKRLLKYNCTLVPEEEIARICENPEAPIEGVFDEKKEN